VFTIPDHIPPTCADLIRQMLVVDPLKRITIGEIRKHPWFLVRLPKYLTFSPSAVQRPIQEIDEEILNDLLSKYNDMSITISRDKLVEELRRLDVNDFIVAYHLLYDAKRHPLLSEETPRSTMENSEHQNLREGEVCCLLIFV
jgi:5'-AMP-activated protein kinase, catalytic alpha subunit